MTNEKASARIVEAVDRYVCARLGIIWTPRDDPRFLPEYGNRPTPHPRPFIAPRDG